jgi:FKBP-type peptidyl-prolyl cis-trans isomerase
MPDASMEKDDGEYGVFKILTKGDSVSFQLTAETMFTKTRKRPVPANVDPKSLFSFNLGIRDTWTREQVDSFQQEMMADSDLIQSKRESEKIDTYLKENGIVAQSIASGIRYVVKKEGKGALAVAGQTAFVRYAGYSLNGKLFDTNIASVAKENNFDNQGRNESYPVVVSKSNVIRGWHQMLALMNNGMQVTVYIPSSLGYGQQGKGPSIPPNTILVFDMELADIK